MSTIDPLKLRDLLIAYFDIEELNGLMFGSVSYTHLTLPTSDLV